MKNVYSVFFFITGLELIACMALGYYVMFKSNLGLGALVIGFIILMVFLYYVTYFAVLIHREKNYPKPSIGWLLFFNILPVLLSISLLYLG